MSLEEERRKEAEKLEKLAERVERELKEKEDLQVKTLSEVLKGANKVYYVDVPELSCRLAYKKPSIQDYIELQNETDKTLYSVKLLYRMLRAADPSVTWEEFSEAIPFDVAVNIAARIIESAPFLLKRRRRESKTSLGAASASQSG